MLAELVEIVPGGVEEERGRTYVEYAIYGEPGEVPALPTLEAAAAPASESSCRTCDIVASAASIV